MYKYKVSVIMATYNTKKEQLKASIESILNQTLKDFEFIIVVDGGNDDEIIKQYEDKRIKIIKNDTTKGLPYSLNKALDVASGEYIARMDSDDISLKDRLNIQYKYMERHRDIDVCAMYYRKFGDANKTITNIWKKNEYLKAQLFYSNCIAHSTVMFRGEFIKKNNIKYSLEFVRSQDYELWTRLSRITNISIIPKVGLYYRIHKNQVSSTKKDEQKELFNKILKRNLSELNIPDENLKYMQMLSESENNTDYQGLSKFIDLVIEQNNKLNVYNKNVFKQVLNIAYSRKLFKNNKKMIFKIYAVKRYLHIYTFTHFIKRVLNLLRYDIFYINKKETM